MVGNIHAAHPIGRYLGPLGGGVAGLLIALTVACVVAAQSATPTRWPGSRVQTEREQAFTPHALQGLLGVSWDPGVQSPPVPNPRRSPPVRGEKTQPAQPPAEPSVVPFGPPVLALGVLLLLLLGLDQARGGRTRTWQMTVLEELGATLRPKPAPWPTGHCCPSG